MDKAGLQALVRRDAADVAEKHKLLFLVSKAELWKGLEESEVMGVLREAVAETASAGQAGAANADAERRFERIYILETTGDDARPFINKRLRDVTKAQVVAALRPLGIFSLIARTDLPERLKDLDWNDFNVDNAFNVALDYLELQEGEQYLPVYLRTNVEQSVKALHNWQGSMTIGDRDVAGELAVKALKERGHPDAKQYCGTRKVRTADQRVVAEFAGAAIAFGCALVVRSKPTLDLASAEQLVETLQKIEFQNDLGFAYERRENRTQRRRYISEYITSLPCGPQRAMLASP